MRNSTGTRSLIELKVIICFGVHQIYCMSKVDGLDFHGYFSNEFQLKWSIEKFVNVKKNQTDVCL